MQLNFPVSQTAPATGASICFPLGDYPVEIVKEEQKPVSGKPNCGLQVYHLKILDGPFKGQSQLYRLNLWNDNETAVNIARSELAALAIVTGRQTMTDSSQLLGAQLIATIGPQEENPKYSDVKIVKDIHGRTAAEILGGAAPAQQQQQPVQQQPITAAFGPTPGQQPQPTFPGFAQPAAPAQPQGPQFAGPHGPASFPAAGAFGGAVAQPAAAAPASPFANASPTQPIAPWQAGK